MAHEGMVHALSEIRRVLVPDGVLIDLRPFTEEWRIEVLSARETRETGQITPEPVGVADDEAANRAMAEAKRGSNFPSTMCGRPPAKRKSGSQKNGKVLPP
jgi:hypothetical protein